MKEERITALDFVRVAACFFVITCHFNAKISGFNGTFLYNNSVIPNYYLGNRLYLGNIGVSLFFILSGVTLMLSYRPGRLLDYYKKRFLRMMPMYWLAYAAATVVDFFLFKGLRPGNLNWLLVTMLGMDGYLGTAYIPSAFAFYVLGEWFLGCILLLYAVFPLLHRCLEKRPLVTCCVVFLSYVILVRGIPFTDYVPKNVEFYLRIPEILLGMLIVKYGLIRRPIALTMFSLLVAICGFLARNHIANLTFTVACCLPLFGVLLWVGSQISSSLLTRAVVLCSGLTYPVFLIHHWLIERMITGFELADMRKRNILMMYAIYLAATLILSAILKKYTGLGLRRLGVGSDGPSRSSAV